MRRPSGWGNQTNCIWLCVPCNVEMHGSLEIDYHFDKIHEGKRNFPLRFGREELKTIIPNCQYIIADCRKERNIVIPKRSKW